MFVHKGFVACFLWLLGSSSWGTSDATLLDYHMIFRDYKTELAADLRSQATTVEMENASERVHQFYDDFKDAQVAALRAFVKQDENPEVLHQFRSVLMAAADVMKQLKNYKLAAHVEELLLLLTEQTYYERLHASRRAMNLEFIGKRDDAIELLDEHFMRGPWNYKSDHLAQRNLLVGLQFLGMLHQMNGNQKSLLKARKRLLKVISKEPLLYQHFTENFMAQTETLFFDHADATDKAVLEEYLALVAEHQSCTGPSTSCGEAAWNQRFDSSREQVKAKIDRQLVKNYKEYFYKSGS